MPLRPQAERLEALQQQERRERTETRAQVPQYLDANLHRERDVPERL